MKHLFEVGIRTGVRFPGSPLFSILNNLIAFRPQPVMATRSEGDVLTISEGNFHNCVVREDSAATAWKDPRHGRCGCNVTLSSGSTPRQATNGAAQRGRRNAASARAEQLRQRLVLFVMFEKCFLKDDTFCGVRLPAPEPSVFSVNNMKWFCPPQSVTDARRFHSDALTN